MGFFSPSNLNLPLARGGKALKLKSSFYVLVSSSATFPHNVPPLGLNPDMEEALLGQEGNPRLFLRVSAGDASKGQLLPVARVFRTTSPCNG